MMRHCVSRAARPCRFNFSTGWQPVLRNAAPLSALISAIALSIVSSGCDSDGPAAPTKTVVLYTSVDQPIAEPIVRAYEREHPGVRIVLQTDAEANKTVGLVERLLAEHDNPQADVWWGNEPFHSVRLANEGILAPYQSPAASDIPTRFKDAAHRWVGVGLRARVIAVSTETSQQIDYNPFITSIEELTNPAFKGRIAMARPTAGTTGSHVAALYVLWGDERADAFFRKLRGNEIALLGGNGPVAESVGQGHFVAGLTDNDDIAAARRGGGALRPVIPDQGTFGTLALPTTVGLVSGARNVEAARHFIDYLVTRQVENALMEAKFAGWSVRGDDDKAIMAMQIDYAAVAEKMPEAVRRSTAILEGRE